jgi:ribosomal protein S18 acetylase RimI-like enzyme
LDIEYKRGSADVGSLVIHLLATDNSFLPPLSSRINICDYAGKVSKKSELFEAWAGQELVGLVAAYCNDPSKQIAFITSVSVLPKWQARGIASTLLNKCLVHVRNMGFKYIQLEVNHNNRSAISLYTAHGFTFSKLSGETHTMMIDFL